ncbi:hypothetical protein AC578_1885 [Pseudocercospora eumusae]|uniref:FAD-binding PCMH-type domain-containing protein n=1 Tax=Pseudocercospora eumusae TaxID=321146 RepID=A0A139H3I5_9PEZI|nr:hypothetical protein AC578_1885 [Pseudocercospora eumusae]KXS97003.1 hypothetical protein AC578_1885 [Pseudocercospora eumusae]KXS97004.1 hypothetical protein AC578_1885 [Pseudocercospora eumusae]
MLLSQLPIGLLVAATSASSLGPHYPLSNVQHCCQKLVNVFPGQVVSPNASDYIHYTNRWTENARLEPACIFLPKDARDIATAIKTFHRSRHSGGICPFAVKSGGHMPHAGANSINNGIVIDLTFINEVTVADDRSYVIIGSGQTWSKVYDELAGTDLAVPGGRCAGTGVGGIALGGGYSWLTPKVGWVADNVLNYELVTASGEILTVNRTSWPDLFQALKGGGNNFGIVTRFDVKTFEHDQKLLGGHVLLPINVTEEVLKNFDGFMQDRGQDENAALALEFVMHKNNSQSQILTWITAGDGKADGHPSLRPLVEMQNQSIASTYGPTTFAEYPGAVPPVSRVLFATVTIKAGLRVLEEVHRITIQVYKDFSHIPDLIWDVQYEPMPKAYRDRGYARSGGNVMALNYTDEDLVIVFLMPLWQEAVYDDEVYQAVQTWLDRVYEYINVNDVGYPFQYINYAAPFQDPLASYGAPNLQFMRNVAKKDDPDELFQRALPGGFKLSEASGNHK